MLRCRAIGVDMHPEVRPQLRYGRESIERPGCTQQTRKATRADARSFGDPLTQKMLARQSRELEVDRVLGRCQISGGRDEREPPLFADAGPLHGAGAIGQRDARPLEVPQSHSSRA